MTTTKTALLPLILLAAGCAKIRIPAYTPLAPPAAREFLVGAGKADITPPPGYPLGGHSIGGQMARGYWTHLYARAFYFQKPGGQPLVLITCELFAIPAGLHARVAQELGVPPESLLISATHTHHGPAGFMSSSVFNFGGPLPFYDERLAKFLAGRIEEAYKAARTDAMSGGAGSIVLRSGLAVNLQRNRAIDAFFLNPPEITTPLLDASRDALMTCPDPASENQCPRFQAADPTLDVLEVLRGGQRIGLLVFFAIHNTAMSHDCTLYQSDLSGYAMHQLETADGHRPIVAGFFNGAEGDVSPRWVEQNRGDVERIGGDLANAVTNLLTKPGDVQSDPAISASRLVVPVASTSGLTRPGSGVGELGGAEDGRTVLYAYGWHGGVTVNGSDPKMPALDLHNLGLLKILKPILASPNSYPQQIPVAAASLGTLSLAAIPTEMTTTQGWRLREELRQATGRPFVIVGLANEYIGYTTTREEYAQQNYEGASTMYGPGQGEVLTGLMLRAAQSPPPPPVPVHEMVFDPGVKATYPFGPQFFGEAYKVAYQSLEPLMDGPEGRLDDSAKRFQWSEPSSADWNAADRWVYVLKQDGAGWREIDNDRGFEILTVLVDGHLNEKSTEPNVDRRVWTAIWVPRRQNLDRSAYYVFWVKPPGKAAVCSKPFQPSGAVMTVPPAPLDTSACPAWRKP
jgi:neutral ceramidase